MRILKFALLDKYPLAAKTLGYILLCSSIVTALLTAFQLYLDFSADVSSIQNRLAEIGGSVAPGVAENVWVMHEFVIQDQLTSLVKLPDVVEANVISTDGLHYSAGSREAVREVTIHYVDLYHPAPNDDAIIGRLEIVATTDGAYMRIKDKVLVILVSQFVKTFLVSLLIFVIFYRTVSRHLNHVSEYANRISLEQLKHPLSLDRPSLERKTDELDQLVDAINHMQKRLAHDVRQIESMESAVRESEEQLQSMLRASKVGLWAWDVQRNETYFSQTFRAQLGFDEQELSGMDEFVALIHPEDRAAYLASVKHYVSSPVRLWEFEFRVKRKDGSYRWMLSRANVIQSDDEYSERLLGCHIDITTRKRLEDDRELLISELEEKNTEMESFVYTVSHDLKSPLVTLSNHVGMLKEDLDEGRSHQISAHFDKIENAISTQGRLLQSVLDVSRAGRSLTVKKDVSIGAIIESARRNVAVFLDAKNVTLEIETGDLHLDCDEIRLMQVFQNLMENSSKFFNHTAQPKIWISCRSENERVVCSVRDNGDGVNPNYISKIFQVFEKLDGSAPGSGIGLAIVKRIIELHKGRIWAESEGEGKGLTIWIEVPHRYAV